MPAAVLSPVLTALTGLSAAAALVTAAYAILIRYAWRRGKSAGQP